VFIIIKYYNFSNKHFVTVYNNRVQSQNFGIIPPQEMIATK